MRENNSTQQTVSLFDVELNSQHFLGFRLSISETKG